MQHKDYDISTGDYDIAIIRLPEELTFNDRVEPVCLPSKAATEDDVDNCVVTGWGRTSGKRHTTSIIILHTSFVVDNIVRF